MFVFSTPKNRFVLTENEIERFYSGNHMPESIARKSWSRVRCFI